MNTSIRSHKTTRWLAATTLILALSSPAFAGKGDKGNGGGGGDPAIELVPAPVEYRVTWLDWGYPSSWGQLADVNAAGVAVGWTRSDDYSGFMADAEGNTWNLDDYFAEGMLSFPGWRLALATAINDRGEVACLLFPEPYTYNPPVIVAIGDIHATPPTLTEVASFPSGVVSDFNDLSDINENGDIVIELEWVEGEHTLQVYPYPGTGPVETVPAPSDATVTHIGGSAVLNEDREVTFSATVTTTVTRGKKSSDVIARRAYLWRADGTFLDLGALPYDGGARLGAGIGLSGTGDVFANFNGIPSIWSAATGEYEAIAPSGYVETAADAVSGGEVVIRSSSSSHMIYRSGYGTSAANVTSGLNGDADVSLWVSQTDYATYPIFRGISAPNETDSGYMVGTAALEDGSFWDFILTPIPVQP